MKLPIKKEYFEQIREGKKIMEWRDAHITFVCEETGEELYRWISGVMLVPVEGIAKELQESGCFDDEMLVGFKLSTDYPIYNGLREQNE